jgi:Zn-dependent alcohol dehydrogenase
VLDGRLLDEVNKAFAAMQAGELLRAVLLL